uniref:Putative capsid protein n=1 Tax=viral metagenome TaxID=1070528 RepID=A0A6M3LN81_9ZZZZ
MAVDTALKNQYSSNIMLLVQQLTAKVVGTVYQKPDCAGEVSYQDQIASETAQEKTARNQVVVNTDPDYDRRKIVPRYFYMAPLIDKMDKVMMLKDPTSEVVQTNAAALARAKDTTLCTAFFATAYSGKAGGTSNTLTGDQVIAAGAAGLNMNKIREAKKVLDVNEVDDNDRYFAYTGQQLEDLLAITEVTSADYAQVKALVNGQPGTICGFQFVRTQRLPISGTTRQCAAYHKTGMVFGTWLDMLTSIDVLPGKHFSAQVYAGQSYGATRLEEKKVVEVDCTE